MARSTIDQSIRTDASGPNKVYWLAGAVVLLLGFGLTLVGIGRESFWFDEAYSASRIRSSFIDIASGTAADTHPPLFYWGLKAFASVFGRSEVALRSFSAVGLVAFAALGLGPVRRLLGARAGLVFCAAAFLVPMAHMLGQEARMYTWTPFAVTGAFTWGILALRERRPRDFALFVLSALAAAYLHYYGLLAVAVISIGLVAFATVREPRAVSRMIASCILVAIGYAPWIGVLHAQASRVAQGFWIGVFDRYHLWNTFLFPFSYKFSVAPAHVIDVSTAGFAAVCLVLAGGLFVMIRRRDGSATVPLVGLGVWGTTIGAAYVISAVVCPVFIERYSMAVIGLPLMAVSASLAAFRSRAAALGGGALLVLASVPVMIQQHRFRFNGTTREIAAFLGPNVPKAAVFVHDGEHNLGCFHYYFPAHRHYLLQPPGSKPNLIAGAFLPEARSGSDVASFVRGRDTVYAVHWAPSPVAFAPAQFDDPSEWTLSEKYTIPNLTYDGRLKKDSVPPMPHDSGYNPWYVFNIERWDRSARASGAEKDPIRRAPR